MKSSTVLTVTQLNTYIKSIIDGDMLLKSIYVLGEISNFTNHYRTGHYYMTLKDGNCAIKAVMFRSANQRLRFMPENGMSVIVRGRVSVFERDGQYQLYVEDMQPDGVGALNLAFEQLKNRLAQEGLFDNEYKKAIPARCYRIGVVTSATGAVLQDIKNVVSRRFPLARIILAPVQVQGASAAPQIVQAIDDFNSGDYADVLIVGRGGGSLEDLWAFNEEIVAPAVFRSRIPVISAVGHETDFTICDFVADLRAPTPSAAAELAVPDIRDDYAFVQTAVSQSEAVLLERIFDEENRLEIIKERLKYRSPAALIDERLQIVDSFLTNALLSIEKKISNEEQRLRADAAKLDALSPMKVMSRGYSIVRTKDGVITQAEQLKKGDRLTVVFSDGEKNCEVI
ncbi:MAG: exodeoxyribonuclease VII large subunit [Ruminococcus sp.]|nr:exodeoxyribonuclease VII large subunit [Candidatus Copronaster equi]